MINIHVDASSAFSDSAETLAMEINNSITSEDKSSEKIEDLLSGRYIDGEISLESTNSPIIKRNHMFPENRLIGLSIFDKSGDAKILNESHCTKLLKFTDSVWRAGNISDFVDKDYIIDRFLHWIFYKDKSTPKFIDYFLKISESEIENHRILIPLFNVQSDYNFELLDARIRTIQSAEIDSWLRSNPNIHNASNFISKIQGLVGVELNITAVSNRAFELAMEKSRLVASLLAFHSIASLEPRYRHYGVPLSSEYTPKEFGLFLGEKSELLKTISGYQNQVMLHPFHMDRKVLEIMQASELLSISSLFDDDKKTQLEMKIRDSLVIYFKSLYTDSSSEKLIFMIVSIEAFFIRNENEPITDNISRRLAYFIENDSLSRKNTIGIIKTAYSLRSKYMHHGKTVEDLNNVKEFMLIVKTFFIMIVSQKSKWKTTDQFLDYLEDCMMS